MKLSVLMPVFNEGATVERAVKRVLDVPWPCEMELVVVDDGSTDSTASTIAAIDDPRVRTTSHAHNRGKGAAVRTAAELAEGDYIVICDADNEYSPEEIPSLLTPILRGDTQVVLGSRTFGSHNAWSFKYVMGNKVTTFAANALYDSWISDMHTCFKVLPLALFRDLPVREDGFGLDSEIIGWVLRRGIRPYEVPISYNARTHAEGKKLTARDGIESLVILARVRFAKDRTLGRRLAPKK